MNFDLIVNNVTTFLQDNLIGSIAAGIILLLLLIKKPTYFFIVIAVSAVGYGVMKLMNHLADTTGLGGF